MRFLGRFFRSVWHGLDLLRRVLHLILMLFLLALLAGLLRGSLPRMPDQGALVIHPSGTLVEQLSGEPLQRALSQYQGDSDPQTLLWDITESIRAAATDKRIQALLIETDDMGSAGQAKLEEISAAIAEFKKSGKKVIAAGAAFNQQQYYLAAQADEIYLDPFGYVLIDGYDRYRMYYKDAIDKLGVDMHLFRAGKFKSAMEPYIRRDMSEEDRIESLGYLQALWGGYQKAIASARGRAVDDVLRYSDEYAAAVKAAGGDTAAVAKSRGLVTDLKTSEQVEQRMVALVGADTENHGFRGAPMAQYLRVLRAEQKLHQQGTANVGVVIASGEILDGRQAPGTIGGESTAELLRQARQDKDLKAVVIRVDSPGGSVFASEQIYREVQALKSAGKTVVISMGDVAASGGYYIAAPADEILASPNTITGSIGVFAGLPTFNRSLAKLGVNVDGVGTTALSGATRLDRPLSADAAQILQSSVDHTYAEFLARVAKGRGKTPEQIDAIAQGRVWAGKDALGLGLIDTLGGYDDALKAAARRAGLGRDFRVKRIEPELTWGQQLVLGMRSEYVAVLERAGFAHAAATLGVVPQAFDPVARELARWQRMATPSHLYAYCFCSPE